MSGFQITTCSDSLLRPGDCCVCHEPATVAVLTKNLAEHARCEKHGTGAHLLAVKPLVWDTVRGAA